MTTNPENNKFIEQTKIGLDLRLRVITCSLKNSEGKPLHGN